MATWKPDTGAIVIGLLLGVTAYAAVVWTYPYISPYLPGSGA